MAPFLTTAYRGILDQVKKPYREMRTDRFSRVALEPIPSQRGSTVETDLERLARLARECRSAARATTLDHVRDELERMAREHEDRAAKLQFEACTQVRMPPVA
ncbi:hypothetical protein [Sphingomonas baiyangensis]|uniref:Uncharacterized protein n=1 Tax=Sphingomonas baiyangensis TaxID=2572576 RepID=A0A4U1L484_9SPHN|nr:hypothetical protein [Sphingomonas baiyangensis]TKD51562.1 hypothetical protein FBR43_12955 [Sphingomonas baiyangensis]